MAQPSESRIRSLMRSRTSCGMRSYRSPETNSAILRVWTLSVGECSAMGSEKVTSMPADADPVEIALALQVLQPIEHPSHVVRAAVTGQCQELFPQLGALERLLRRALEVGDAARERAPIAQVDGDGGGERGRAALPDRDGHTLAQRADLRIL